MLLSNMGWNRFLLLFISPLLLSPLSAVEEEMKNEEVVSLSKQHMQRKKITPESYIIVEEDAVNRSGMTELKIGDAPTKKQLKALKEDMVWIKEEEIAGFKMFFPVVYLAEEKEPEQKAGGRKSRTKKGRRARRAR